MMFRDINQSSTMARSAYPDGNGELTDFNLFATKYDAGKPSIATDGLPSELSYQVRTAIRRAVDELGINVPEAAVVLKYPIHFYYSDASAELTGVLALPGAVAILALDGFVPKEQLAAPVIGDISRLRETVDELRRRGGLEPLPVRETIYTHTVPEGTVVANQRPAAYRATGRKKGTAMDQEKYDNEVSVKFPAKWCRVTDAQGKDIVIENGKKTETWPAVLCTIPTGTDMNGIDISGYKFKTFRKPWTESDIANGKGTTVTVKKDMSVHLFKYDENDQLKTLDADPFELSKAVKAAREAYKAKMNAEAPNPQSQAAAAVAAAHGTAEQGGGCAAGTKVSAVYVPVGDLPRETTIFPDMARAAASIGLEDPETETLAEYGGVTVSLVRAADAEGSELKPNRAWARGGATEIVRGGFLVIATDGDGEVVDLPKWAIESAKTRFADPSTGPFQASAEFMREVRRGLGEQIEQAGRTPSDIAALASQLAAKPGDDGGAGGKRI